MRAEMEQFISHIVNVKQLVPSVGEIELTVFISHIVNVKPQIYYLPAIVTTL